MAVSTGQGAGGSSPCWGSEVGIQRAYDSRWIIRIIGQQQRPQWAQKNRFEVRNGDRGNNRENKENASGEIGKTDGGEVLSGHSRVLAKQGSALRQRVFWLEHDAKLRHCYASIEHIKQEFQLG